MRNLTIYRAKAMAACLMSVSFYITSNASLDEGEEVEIGGEQCKKLGQLNNNEEQTFLIGEGSAKVFAIYGLSSRNIWDQIKIPAGPESIRIGGKCRLAPSVGNPFNFEEKVEII